MKKTILVVDDFTSVRMFICLKLEKEHLATQQASSGEEVLRMLLEHPGKIDLLLTDYHLPDCTGLELLKKVRAHPAIAGLPVIFVTAESSPEKIKRAEEAGLSAWIQKPYLPDTIYAEVKRILGLNANSD